MLFAVCHDNTLRIEDWTEELGPSTRGFSHPGKFLEDLEEQKQVYQGQENIFIFDRMWMHKIDMCTDPIMEKIRKQASDLNVKWILASNHHDLGDQIKGWDLVKDGSVLSKEELLSLLNG